MVERLTQPCRVQEDGLIGCTLLFYRGNGGREQADVKYGTNNDRLTPCQRPG